MTQNTHHFNHGLQSEAEKHNLFPDTRSEWQRGMDVVNERSALARAAKKDGIAYEPIEQTPLPYNSRSEALTALVVELGKPIIAIVAVGAFVWVMVATVAAGVAAIFAFVTAHAMWIGGGLFAVVVLGLGMFGAKAGGEAKAGSSGEGEWEEFSQRQEQTFKRRKV